MQEGYTKCMTSDLIAQLRVTAAQPGKVNFELDIQKEHTVGNLHMHKAHQ